MDYRYQKTLGKICLLIIDGKLGTIVMCKQNQSNRSGNDNF